MQEGVINERAADYAREAGLKVVMDKCMRKELFRMLLREEEYK
jgi:predicted CoA-binding protein